MKRLLLIMVVISFFSCQKDSIKEYINVTEVEDIQILKLFANSDKMYADGKAEIEFTLRAYGTYEKTVQEEQDVDGETVIVDKVVLDTFLLKEDRLPVGTISIYNEDDEKIAGNSFSTSSGAGTTISFYAKAGDVKSELFEVELKEVPQTDFEEIVIPVVFHIVSNKDTKYSSDGVTVELINKKLKELNDVFAGNLHNAPMSVDSKIRFELAENDDDNEPLENAGINRVHLGDKDGVELLEHIKESLMWDPSKYLNIWIATGKHQYGWNIDEIVEAPEYIDITADTLKGLNLTEVDDFSELEYEELGEIGILVSAAKILDKDFVLANELGTFLGLLPTKYYTGYGAPKLTDGDVDYCDDTYTFWRGAMTREKRTYEDYYYKSYNIMDDYSTATTVSYKQIVRMRTVLEHCAFRQFRK